MSIVWIIAVACLFLFSAVYFVLRFIPYSWTIFHNYLFNYSKQNKSCVCLCVLLHTCKWKSGGIEGETSIFSHFENFIVLVSLFEKLHLLLLTICKYCVDTSHSPLYHHYTSFWVKVCILVVNKGSPLSLIIDIPNFVS